MAAMGAMGGRPGESLLLGISARASLTDCPLDAFEVVVTRCGGEGDCVASCPTRVFEKGMDGRCTVVNDFLCFGCMTCVAQCLEGGVRVFDRGTPRYEGIEEILR